ncbi:PAS domain-containing protein [Thermodesulfobacterium thermophilum]|uniref:PAS domain-containing protein n=1 Tax=Thermodesulfobacterium thermophilum TaxID=886 RepID=UPI0003B76B73|nr:PAS domain-containing protein [Thermodesulfobacterium thermophilum]
MNLSDILIKINETINFYLLELSNIGLVLIDRKGEILDCNKGFLKIVGLREKPIKQNIKNFLTKNKQKISLPKNSFTQIDLLLNVSDKTEILSRGYIFSCNKLYLIILEHYRITYSELIEKMSKLNDQIVDITRELEKKNLQLSNALATVRKIMNTDPLTGILNRRAGSRI